MQNSTDEIEYKFLNMDTSKFVSSQQELEQQTTGGTIRAIPNWNHGQVLYAAGRKYFDEHDAIIRCRRLSGLIK